MTEPKAGLDPATWPRWARRAFVLTLPISGPIYIVAMFALMAVAVPFLIALCVYWYIIEPIWTGRKPDSSSSCARPFLPRQSARHSPP